MTVGIVCDSSLNVPDEVLKDLGIIEVPALVIFGPDEVYLNKVEISIEEFYRRFLEEGAQPTTSQPTPLQFAEAYRQVGTKEILSVTVSSRLSGTYNSAVQGAAMVAEEGLEVTVWDTLYASMAGGWHAIHAARMARAGATVPDILAELEAIRARTIAWLTVDTLTYLARAGRVSALRASVGNVLNVKPILTFRDGYLEPVGRERGRKRARQALIDRVRQQAGDRPLRLAVAHANVPDEAASLMAECERAFEVEESYIVELGPVLAAVGGPGLLGITGYPVR